MKKPRNPVAEAAAYLTKPSRHRDRKHDYARREKHRKSGPPDEEVLEHRKKRYAEKYSPEDEDWYYDSEGELGDSFWLESDDDTPDASEVQQNPQDLL